MVRAIDMQQVITQAFPVEKVQQTQQQHPDIQQRYFDIKLNEEQRILREKIKNTEDTRETKITDRESKQGERQETGRRKAPGEQEHQTEKTDSSIMKEEGSIIDIKA
jgi:hypothetical protein